MSAKKNNIEIGAAKHKRGRSNSGVQLVINPNTSKLEVSPISTICSPQNSRRTSTSMTLRMGSRPPPPRRGSATKHHTKSQHTKSHHTKSTSNEPSWAKDLNFMKINSLKQRVHHFSNHRTKSPTIDEEDSDMDGETSGDSNDSSDSSDETNNNRNGLNGTNLRSNRFQSLNRTRSNRSRSNQSNRSNHSNRSDKESPLKSPNTNGTNTMDSLDPLNDIDPEETRSQNSEQRASAVLENLLKSHLEPHRALTVTPSLHSANSDGAISPYPMYNPSNMARHSEEISISSLTLQRSKDLRVSPEVTPEVTPEMDSDQERSSLNVHRGHRRHNNILELKEHEKQLEDAWRMASDSNNENLNKHHTNHGRSRSDRPKYSEHRKHSVKHSDHTLHERSRSDTSAAVDTIDLSPIEESTLSKLSRVNKVDFQYGTHGPEYVKRFNGKRIRVGFRKKTKEMKEWTAKTVKVGKVAAKGVGKVAAKRVQHPHHHMTKSGKVEYNAVYAGNPKGNPPKRERLVTLSQVDEDSADSVHEDFDDTQDDGLHYSDHSDHLHRGSEEDQDSEMSPDANCMNGDLAGNVDEVQHQVLRREVDGDSASSSDGSDGSESSGEDSRENIENTP